MLARTMDHRMDRTTDPMREQAGGLDWYLVRSIGRRHDQVMGWLDRCHVEAYAPQVREMRPALRRSLSRAQRKAGVTLMRPRIVALFPGYYFVRLDLAATGWHELFRLGGLAGLVCAGSLPVRIDGALIDRLRSAEVNGAVPGTASMRVLFRVGDRVLITDGLFARHHAVVERELDSEVQALDAELRLTVAVELFGRPVRIDLTPEQVARI